MINKNMLLKERISLVNGMLFYLDTFLKPIDCKNGQAYFCILPNNEKLKVIIFNDTLITYKEYIEGDYKVSNYSIRNRDSHSRVLIKNSDKLEMFLTNSNDDDAYISIDKRIDYDYLSILEIIKNKLGSICDFVEDNIYSDLNNIFEEEKNKKYIKKI